MGEFKDFKRGLGHASWDALDRLACEDNNWWKDLLSLWVPSGQPAGDYGLRLALRRGYLNFYRRGQSVAKVRFGQRRNEQVEARMEIHAKYVWCKEAPDEYAQLRGCTVTCKGMLSSACYAGLTTLKKWIAETESRTGKEKWGVDMVVGNNATVIDLEMAMPAWSGTRSALRVDMAALDVTGVEPRLVLWEAKPLHADALKARSDDIQVISQMNAYKAYLNAPGHRERLDEAYRTTCSALLQLAEMAGPKVKLHDSLGRVAGAERLEVALEPRLAVFQGVERGQDGNPELVKFSDGWAAHLDKLRRRKVQVADGRDPSKLRLEEAE